MFPPDTISRLSVDMISRQGHAVPRLKPTPMKTLFDDTKAAWTPDPEDNPDCHWFYASWTAMAEVFRRLGLSLKSVHHSMHQALCMAQGDWEGTLAQLRQALPFPRPEKPERPLWQSRSKPVTDEKALAKEARELFKSEFKRKFPGERCNSKHANEKWRSVEAKALTLAKERFQNRLERWQEEENRRAEEHSARLADWRKECQEIDEKEKTLLLLLESDSDRLNYNRDLALRARNGQVGSGMTYRP